MPELQIPPSSTAFGGKSFAPGQWFVTIPSPGGSELYLEFPIVGGLRASCSNLLADSPPTLLEQYVLQSYRIGFSVLGSGSDDIPTAVKAELAFIVNSDTVHTNTMTGAGIDEDDYWGYSDTWTADLTNPISLGARDTLKLQVRAQANVEVEQPNITVGVQLDMNAEQVVPCPSTISYTTVKVPATRRL